MVTWLSVRLAWRVGNNLRRDLCRHALAMDLHWHGDHSPGQLIERIDGDIDAVTRFSSTAVLQLLGNTILVAGVLVVSAVIDWRASVLIGLTVAAAVAVMVRLRRLAVPFYDDEREVQAQLYGDVEERLGGLEDLRANGAGRWAEHRLQQHSAGWWRTARRCGARRRHLLAGAVFGVGSVLVLALGVGQPAGHALGGLGAHPAAVQPARERPALEGGRAARRGTEGHRRHARRRPAPGQPPGPGGRRRPALPAGALEVELREVTFGYGTGHPVLDHVDLVVPAGTTLGVVGRTGSGKTTVGRLIARLWDTEEGAVLVGGVDVRACPRPTSGIASASSPRTSSCCAPAARQPHPVRVGGGRRRPSDRRATRRRARPLAGLPAQRPRRTARRRCRAVGRGGPAARAFARVLLADPAVVILDEASSRLDPATEAQLARATDRLLAGRTALVIAHRLATLDRVDRIAVLDHGRLVEHGERAELAADPTSRYAQLLAGSRATEGVAR
ncbi:MAG: ABC transporter ATP-binding protein [Acidimicrobiales bacterium]